MPAALAVLTIYLIIGANLAGLFRELGIFGLHLPVDHNNEDDWDLPMSVTIFWPFVLFILWKWGDPFKT